eukprot:340583-Rhodomonas_salina.1
MREAQRLRLESLVRRLNIRNSAVSPAVRKFPPASACQIERGRTALVSCLNVVDRVKERKKKKKERFAVR